MGHASNQDMPILVLIMLSIIGIMGSLLVIAIIFDMLITVIECTFGWNFQEWVRTLKHKSGGKK